jgi:taurine dioxygenase
MDVRPIASALGAEVSGVDLSQPLSDSQVQALRQAWLEHLVLLFRDQKLTTTQLIEFSGQFGELERHDNYQSELRHPDHPELLVVKARTVGGRRIVFGQQWHSDLSYTLRPSMGSCLYCLHLPSVGGDTLFANMYKAYEALSPAMQRIVDRLQAVHDLSNGRSHSDATPEQRAATLGRNPPVIQPVVRVHPETGRRALFVSEWMCSRIVGMTEDEGLGLLQFLFEHSTRPEFTLRQIWRVNDVLMWDNRATVHMALADYPAGELRELLRTSIRGEPHGLPLHQAAA